MLKCPICDERYKEIEDLGAHLEEEHIDSIPKNFTPTQYLYFIKTGKEHGSCVICKKPTKWNETTGKYNRFCDNPKCKEKYRNEFKKRMIGKYGKIHLLDSPDQQKKMLANRKISGIYNWSDGGKVGYTGSYELDFFKMLDVFMNFSSDDIMAPSPHIYYYEYQGEKKFYIPDCFIPSLGVEIEIKDGGNNPNNHHKIQEVDKVKERLKDEVLMSQKTFSYIKITNKNYDPFFDFLSQKKKQYIEEKETGVESKPIFILGESYNDAPKRGSEIVIESKFVANNLTDIYKSRVKYLEAVSTFKETRKELLELIDKAKTVEDIGFIKKDRKMMIDYINSIKNNDESMEDACEDQLNWLKGEYSRAIEQKEKEIQKSYSKLAKITKENNPTGFEFEGIWNSIKWIGDKPYRDAVETLIIKDRKYVFLYFKDDTDYRVPGGSKEYNVDDTQQAIIECEEEAKIKVKNCTFTGITYSIDWNSNKNPKWNEKLKPFKYAGKIIDVYVAEYDSKSNKHIDKQHADKDMTTKGKFYEISEIYNKLNPYHKKALAPYMSSIKESSEEIVMEAANNEKLYPIYILLTYTDTMMARIIRFHTGDPYSHASISFTSKLDDMYSFGRKDKDSFVSFINEDIREGLLKDVSDKASYSLYVVFVTKQQYEMMQVKLEEFKKKADKLKFSFMGLFNIARGKETHRENKYFCSQFVAEILKAGDPSLIKKDPSLYSPYNLVKSDRFFFVQRGTIANYNYKEVDQKVKEIIKVAKVK